LSDAAARFEGSFKDVFVPAITGRSKAKRVPPRFSATRRRREEKIHVDPIRQPAIEDDLYSGVFAIVIGARATTWPLPCFDASMQTQRDPSSTALRIWLRSCSRRVRSSIRAHSRRERRHDREVVAARARASTLSGDVSVVYGLDNQPMDITMDVEDAAPDPTSSSCPMRLVVR